MALCRKCSGHGRLFCLRKIVTPRPVPSWGYIVGSVLTWRRCNSCGGRRTKPCARWQIGPTVIGPGARQSAAGA